MVNFTSERDEGYTLYALVGIVFACVYLASSLFLLLVPKENLDLTTRDYVSGALLAAVFFGMPVIMFIGIVAIIYARVEKKRGKFFGVVTLVAPLVFLYVITVFWYPLESEFWTYSFSSVRAIDAEHNIP